MKPVILLLHGIPGSRATWEAVAGHLEDRYRLVIPDLLGFGEAPDYESDGHADEQADWVLRVLDRERIDRAHVVGFDFGGPVAVTLYRKAPERVLSLTLAATNVLTDTPIPLPLRIARVPIAGELFFRMAFGKWGLSLMWLGATGDRARFPFAAFAKVLESPNGVRTTRHIFLQSLRHLRRYYAEIESTLPRIDVPVSVVWGDRDPFFPVSVGRRVAETIRGSEFVLMEGCGHFLPGERAGEMAGVIERTVARAEGLQSSSSKTANSR